MNLNKIQKIIIGNVKCDDGIETKEVLMEDLKFAHWFKIRFVNDELGLLKLAGEFLMGYRDEVLDCDNAVMIQIVYEPESTEG